TSPTSSWIMQSALWPGSCRRRSRRASPAPVRGPAPAADPGREMTALAKARLLALFVPLALLGGAYGFQYVWGHLWPCEMCWWQRYAHFAALPFAFAAVLFGSRLRDGGRTLVWLAALAILVSGAIGFWHAGIELKLLPGFTQCTSTLTGTPAEMLTAVFDRPIVRCDDVQ